MTGCDLFLDADGGPGISLHVAKRGSFPRLFRMLLKVFRGEEIHPARMTGSGNKFHLCCHLRVGGFILHGAGVPIRYLPGAHAARRKFHVPAESALARFGLSSEGVHVIG